MSAAAATWAAREQVLLDAARDGDEDAYRRLIEPRRAELHAHCYRMLGSVHDAEDALQDALLRAWRALPRFERRSSTRSWLYRIATNTCLDLIARRPKRVLPIDYGPSSDPHDGPGTPLVESVWIEPYPDERLGLQDGLAAPEARYEQRESVELAFVAALQHLPARQRAVLIMREVLGFSAKEVAATLEMTVVVGQQRAPARAQDGRRATPAGQPAGDAALARRRSPARGRRALHGRLGARRRRSGRRAAGRGRDADDAADGDLVPRRGRGRVPREWALSGRVYGAEGNRRVRVLPAHANGQPAIATYSWDREQGRHLPTVLQVLTFAGSGISEITGFVDPSVFPGFGLPDSLPE